MWKSFFTDKKWMFWCYGGGALILSLIVFQTWLSVQFNTWYGTFYDLLQKPPETGGLEKFYERLRETDCKFLVVSFTSDWRFPPVRSREIVKMLLHSEKNVSYSEIISGGGHDAFLMENKDYFQIMRFFIDEVHNSV